jgi:hypothetical protein
MIYVYSDMEAKISISSNALIPVIKAEKNNSGAYFTIVSKLTGKDFTYQINRSNYKGKFFTHIRVEKSYLNFVYLGSYYAGKIWRNKQVIETPASLAIAWVLGNVENNKISHVDNNVELLHTGCCLRCGRTLTDAESIKIGLGPICRSL